MMCKLKFHLFVIIYSITLLFIKVTVCISEEEELKNAQAQVVFKCGFPTIYSTFDPENRKMVWSSDQSQKCIDDAAHNDILKYCQQVYPENSITNIAPAPRFVTIDNWPLFNTSTVRVAETQIARPYHCIGRKYVYPSLSVSKDCQMHLTSINESCPSYEFWNTSGIALCGEKSSLDAIVARDPCTQLMHFKRIQIVCCSNPVIFSIEDYLSPKGVDISDSLDSEMKLESDFEVNLHDGMLSNEEKLRRALTGSELIEQFNVMNKEYTRFLSKMDDVSEVRVTKILEKDYKNAMHLLSREINATSPNIHKIAKAYANLLNVTVRDLRLTRDRFHQVSTLRNLHEGEDLYLSSKARRFLYLQILEMKKRMDHTIKYMDQITEKFPGLKYIIISKYSNVIKEYQEEKIKSIFETLGRGSFGHTVRAPDDELYHVDEDGTIHLLTTAGTMKIARYIGVAGAAIVAISIGIYLIVLYRRRVKARSREAHHWIAPASPPTQQPPIGRNGWPTIGGVGPGTFYTSSGNLIHELKDMSPHRSAPNGNGCTLGYDDDFDDEFEDSMTFLDAPGGGRSVRDKMFYGRLQLLDGDADSIGIGDRSMVRPDQGGIGFTNPVYRSNLDDEEI